MAKRPWVTPEDIKAYSDYEQVQKRNNVKLQADITRAETYIIQRTRNQFNDEEYQEIPPNVKLATMLVAEFYANSASTDPNKKYKSESYKDYSYTVASTSLEDIDIDSLISEYEKRETKGTLVMKLRKL